MARQDGPVARQSHRVVWGAVPDGGVDAFWAAQGKFGMRLTHFSVQGKHLHLIVEGVDKVGLRRSMTGLNVRIAVGLNRAMNSAGRCVKERYHRHILKTPSEVRKAVHYVLRNHERKPKTRTQVRGGA